MMLESVNPLAQGISMVIADVATAQRDYDAHCAKCPGTHLEVYGNPDKERQRQKWVDQKFRLAQRLEVAKAFEKSGWKREGERLEASMPAKTRTGHTQERKPIQELVNCYRDKFEIMAREKPRSPKWISARNQAYGYRYMIRERCKEEHVAMPDLAPVPVLPPKEGPRKSPPLKPLTGDPALDERRRRDRERRRRLAEEKSSSCNPEGNVS
jgi:hypothetical protein